MDIFVASSSKEPYKTIGRRIERIAQRLGFRALNSRSNPPRTTDEESTDTIKAVICEMSEPEQETLYSLAMGLMQKKPVLYLYQGKTAGKEFLRTNLDKSQRDQLTIASYSADDLDGHVGHFLTGVEANPEPGDIPNIKFTLRITKRIEQYLAWRTHNLPMSKADFLRNMIQEMMASDDEYQRYRNTSEDEK